jgi:pimeloyl-ACP methyl ester carboxylesterase
MKLTVNGLELAVHDGGQGEPVLLLHGWPDTHSVWRHQIAALNAGGYRTIAPDLRGSGESSRPGGVDDYGALAIVGDLLGILDAVDIPRAHVVGHDWGGFFGAMLAALVPERVRSLTCVCVGHPGAFAAAGLEQRRRSWYMLLFQFPGIAETWLAQDDFAMLREWGGHPEPEEVIIRYRDRAAITAGLALYRAILPPETLLTPPSPLPPIRVPTLGVWPSADPHLTEGVIAGMDGHVIGPWRYVRLDGLGHWPQLQAPERFTATLLDFLEWVASPSAACGTGVQPTGSGGSGSRV